ncbi:hypothetical protein FFZ99_17790 [Leptospira interrogans]|nr:hypothetical protein B2G47_05205 [Leptospira interrogans serovar Canicola]OMH68944.1 hypothetical protein BW243_05575 [Leptospira interrogans serovar Pomona]TQE53445.1 hypothetical protein FF006_17450 [Leptospira interrogans]OLZ29811.1 hypothetical protein AR546_19670 [Leptospira interrogans serovar Canicola]POR16902.1 hypothetical protein B0T34_17835 [Leptospira interrogans serovar Canicola]
MKQKTNGEFFFQQPSGRSWQTGFLTAEFILLKYKLLDWMLCCNSGRTHIKFNVVQCKNLRITLCHTKSKIN